MRVIRPWFHAFAGLILLSACSSDSQSPDRTPPSIALIGDNPQVIAVGVAYVELGATASDNRDGDISGSIVIDSSSVDSSVPGEYTVTYNVRDAAGNSAMVSRIVRVEDTTPPVVTLLGDDPQIIIIGNPYFEQGASAIDDVEGDLSAAIDVDTSALDVGVVGSYTIVYSVADSAGNTGTVTRTVRVENPPPPVAPTISVTGETKQLVFSWDEAANADYYRLLQNPDGHSGYTQVGEDIPEGTKTARIDIAVHLHDWTNSLYTLQACNPGGCTSSAALNAQDAMLEAIGYFKASNQSDKFGYAIAVSGDGSTLAVGAIDESSGATGINGDQSDSSSPGSGAVYLFRFNGSSWSQTDYIKASNLGRDGFGRSVALNFDGSTLAVGATGEDSGATGINGDQSDDSASSSGAVYLFRFDADSWQQQAYIKASNTGFGDQFGVSLDLSADGNTLAVGARYEASQATGINGDQDDRVPLRNYGAAYLFRFDGDDWYQQAYIKASNTGQSDRFGDSTALSADGNTLAVGAPAERSSATGINGNQGDDDLGSGSGAVYVFRFDGIDWSQQAYIKASNTGTSDTFGIVELSADGDKLAVGAPYEDSISSGIGGEQFDEHPIGNSGAVYLFEFDNANWQQTAYIKSPNPGSGERTPECELDPRPWLCEQPGDNFGAALSLSADGRTLAVGASWEDSSALGVGGDQTDNSAADSGAAYIY